MLLAQVKVKDSPVQLKPITTKLVQNHMVLVPTAVLVPWLTWVLLNGSFLERKMPGHKGHEQVTVLNLVVVDVRPEQNAILIKGALPGPKYSLVKIKCC